MPHDVQQYVTRLQELLLLYGMAPYYTDETFLEAYAKKHRDVLLRSRSEIAQEHLTFHQNPYFIAFLKACGEDRLIAYATWRSRALALAECLDVELAPLPQESPPPLPAPLEPAIKAKPTLTPEERHAKVQGFRDRLLERRATKAEDYIATQKQNLELEERYAEELRAHGLDPQEEEFTRLMQEFRTQLTLLSEPEDANGFKTLGA